MHPPAPASTGSEPPSLEDHASWTIAARRAADPRPGGFAAIDIDAPGEGIRLQHSAGKDADHLLGLDLRPRWQVSDFWPRGADVTAVYESTDTRHLRATAMWRLHPCDEGVRGWQLVVSAQTSLWQSDSILAVTSAISGGPATRLLWGTCAGGAVRWRSSPSPDATCILVRRDGGDLPSVLVAGHPGEVRGIEIRQQPERTTIACWLFSTTLEKGVLLRSRVLAAVGPGRADEEWATAAATAFAALSPMLTT